MRELTELNDDALGQIRGGDGPSFWNGVFNVAIGVLSGGWSGAAQAATGSTEAIMALSQLENRVLGLPDGSGNHDDGALGHGAEQDGAGGVGGSGEPLTQGGANADGGFVLPPAAPAEDDPTQVIPS